MMKSLLSRVRLAAGSAVLGVLFVCISPTALADTKAFRIDSKNAVQALMEFGRQAGREVFFGYENIKGFTTNAIEGDYEPLEALRLLVKDTGLRVSEQQSGIFVVEPQRTAASGTGGGQASLRASDTASVPIRMVSAQSTESQTGSRQTTPSETQQDQSSSGERESTVIVTGSRIKRAIETEGPNPVTVFTREKIERSGTANLSEFLRNNLPTQSGSVTDAVVSGNVGTGQSNINLRGLGNGSTLTLINGRRFALSGNSRINGGNLNNINTIPMGAIERIEVLKDGASAIYGSDAIAGVINIILRKDYNGSEATVMYNNTFDSDSSIMSANYTTGFSSNKGSAVVTVEAYKQNGMLGTDRDFSATADQRSRGGLDQRTTPGVRGTVYALAGQTLPGVFLPNGQPATFAAIPANQNGIGLTPASFAATAGVRDVINQNAFNSTVPERKTINLVGSFNYGVTDDIEFFGQGAYSHIDSFNYIYNVQLSQGQLTIPANNPYNPFGVPVNIEKNTATDFGGGVRSNNYDDYGITAGLRGGLWGDWDWEVGYVYGQSNTENGFNPVNLNRAPVNAAAAAGVAYNWFGDPTFAQVNSADQIAGIQGYEVGEGNGTLRVMDATVRGPLFNLFGNSVSAVVGVEQRRDHYEQAYVSDSRVASTNTFTGIIQQQSRKTTSYYAELGVPLISPRSAVPMAYSLELSLAARHEDLDVYGTTTDPRFGVRYQPVRSLLLRASYGTSFRAPSADQVGSSPLTTTRTGVDPKRGNTQYNIFTLENRDLGIGPEKSKNYSAGIVFEPEALKGLMLSLDWYRIDYEDKFAYLFPDIALRFEDQKFAPYVVRAPRTAQDIAQGYAGVVTQITLGYTNLATTKVSGLDFEARYTWDTALGQFSYGLLGTNTRTYDEYTVPGAAAIHRDNTYNYPKKLQGNMNLFWNRGPWEAGVMMRYVGSYKFDGFGVFNPPVDVESLQEFDVQGAYQFSFGTKLSLNIMNVLNSDPPFMRASSAFTGNFGFDTGVASPRKAVYQLMLRHQF